MRNFTIGALLSLASVMPISQAPAATAAINISGVVVSGVDAGGLFGQQGGDLTGKLFDAQYKITYEKPTQPGPYGNVYYSSNILQKPISTALLAISNASLLNTGTSFSIASMSDGAISPFGYDDIFLANQDYMENDERWVVSRLTFSISSFTQNFVNGADFSQSLQFAPQDNQNGILYSYGYNKKTKTFFDQSIKLKASFLALNVPEPATWAMMVLGFGMIGAIIRHRPKTLKFAYASGHSAS